MSEASARGTEGLESTGSQEGGQELRQEQGPGIHDGLADIEAAGIRLRVGPSGRLQVPKGLDATCEAVGFDASFVRAWLREHNDAVVALLQARDAAERLEAAVVRATEDHAAGVEEGVAERANIMLVEALTECGVDPDASVTPDEEADKVVDLAAIRAAARESYERESAGKTVEQCKALWEEHSAFWERAMGPHAHKLTPEQVERVVELEAAIEAAVMAGQYAQTGRLIRAWQEATTPTSMQWARAGPKGAGAPATEAGSKEAA